MKTVVVWVLSFTVLGVNPEHGSLAKYETKESCEQMLEQYKKDYKEKKKNIVGSCKLVLK